MLEEGEQAIADLGASFSQSPAVVVGRTQHHCRGQFPIQPALMGPSRGLGQYLAPPRQSARVGMLRLNGEASSTPSDTGGQGDAAAAAAMPYRSTRVAIGRATGRSTLS